jgi:hypothetical protein
MVNSIDMVVLSTRYNLLHGPILKFDQKLSIISVKNILIERLASQTIQRFLKKFKHFLKKL